MIYDEEMMLSKHFSLKTMTQSGEAIRLGIANIPQEADIECLKQLCINVLEPLRARFGVLRVTKGYHSPELNRTIGGDETSQHLIGEAADIHVSCKEIGDKMFDFICKNLDYDRLFFEKKMSNGCLWLHVSYTTKHPNRQNSQPIIQHITLTTTHNLFGKAII